eukprot:TRINITY_DN777868_c0_g1_i1.p1 TRINITY_DN777868_c0_g1~~TRINITY_DN777868_c0_g1_i1.p1  ORF type:complete len:783 (-),score=61.32 TRINITY_DN777868_c0_g1_i1:2205-4553(-)
MLKILLNTVIRRLYKQKAYSLINIFGLATGVTCTLLILIWVEYELGFDRFHDDVEQVYSVYENQNYADGDIFSVYSTPSPLAASLKQKYSEVEYASRMISTWGKLVISSNNKSWVEDRGKIVDEDFFEIFSFEIIDRESDQFIIDAESIVLTEKYAKKIFGEGYPIGKLVDINSRYKYKVSAIIKDPPANSSLKFDFLLPVQFFEKAWEYDMNDWEANSFHTFLKLKKHTSVNSLLKRIRYHIKEKVPTSNVELSLQPFKEYHLYSINSKREGPIWYVKIFVLVAVLILLIACFNYMNLATARSEKRGKEVAVRKVVGAQRTGLVGLFLGESVVFTAISLVVAIVLVELLLPTFSELTNRSLTMNAGNFNFIVVVVVIVMLTGIISGSYPALFLSSFVPIQVIKGLFRKDSAILRKILVIIQFTMSIALLICTCVIHKQLGFLKESDIGYNKDNIVYIEILDDFNEFYPKFKDELQKIKGVHWVTAANQMPVDFSNSTWDVEWPGKLSDSEDILFKLSFVDFDFIETFEMTVVQGRGFSQQNDEADISFIINETAARKMDMEYTIGEEITLWGYTGKVIGIVKDFNFNSLQVGVDPLIMMRNPEAFRYVGVRVGEDVQPIINKMRRVWMDLYPKVPFNYRFLEEDFNYFYQAESRMSKLFISFTIIAFIISGLGLFGLVSFLTERKRREMALRKVFGANSENVLKLLVMKIMFWIVLANLIAWGIAFFVMEWWLTGFAYRINISIGAFVFSACISLLLAMVTIYYQIYKLSKIAPASILKYE